MLGRLSRHRVVRGYIEMLGNVVLYVAGALLTFMMLGAAAKFVALGS